MTTVFSNIGTLFFIIIIGYLAVHLKLFSHDGLKILGKYVLTLALPALIFQSIVKQGPTEILNFGYLGGYLHRHIIHSYYRVFIIKNFLENKSNH